MARVKLKDVIIRVNTKVDKDNTDLIYYVGGEHVESENIRVEKRGIIAGSTIGPMFYYGFKAGDFLLVSRNPHLKKAGIVDFDGICSEKTFVLATANPEVLLPEFLPFTLQNDRFWEYAYKNRHGSTNTFINWSTLSNYEFDLPDLDTQHKLAEILWSINDTRKAYKKLITATDELVKSQFIEMFGNSEKSSDQWLEITVRDAIKDGYIARPLDGNHGEKHPKGDDYVTEGVPFIMAQDLKDKKVDFEHCHFITEDQAKTLKKGWAKSGDVLLTHKGTIGRVAIVQPSQYENILLTPQITYYRCLKGIDNEYLAAFFTTDFFTQQLQSMITGTTRASVTITQQEGLKLIIPSMDKQKRFVSFVYQSDKSKFELEQALSELTATYKSIIKENLG